MNCGAVDGEMGGDAWLLSLLLLLLLSCSFSFRCVVSIFSICLFFPVIKQP